VTCTAILNLMLSVFMIIIVMMSVAQQGVVKPSVVYAEL
jgi:hypothetical protein